MKIANSTEGQRAWSIILPMLASDSVHQHLIEIFVTSGLKAGKA